MKKFEPSFDQLTHYAHLIALKAQPGVRFKSGFKHPVAPDQYLLEHYPGGVYTLALHSELDWLGNKNMPQLLYAFEVAAVNSLKDVLTKTSILELVGHKGEKLCLSEKDTGYSPAKPMAASIQESMELAVYKGIEPNWRVMVNDFSEKT